MLTLHSLYWPTSDILCVLQMLLIFFLGARMAISGEISMGTYMAVSGMIIWIIWSMRNLGRIVAQASSALVSYRRVVHIIRAPPEDFSTPSGFVEKEIKVALSFDRVSFEYKAGERVLQEVSFVCEPEEMIALLSKAGSGKTTLVNLLPRFYDYSSGSVLLDGRELRSYPLHVIRRQVGVVEQEPFLFSRTSRRNIVYGAGRPVSQAEIEEAARAAVIHEVVLGFPDGYNTLVGEKGVTLPGGQKQRLVSPGPCSRTREFSSWMTLLPRWIQKLKA